MHVQFVKDIVHIVDSQDSLKPQELRTPSRHHEDHQVWCEKTWKHVLPTLEYWLLELQQLKVAYLSSTANCLVRASNCYVRSLTHWYE